MTCWPSEPWSLRRPGVSPAMTDIETIAARVAANRRVLDQRLGEARAVLARGKELEVEVGDLVAEVADLERVSVLLNSLGEERQAAAQGTIEDLVTKGLQTIFDETLSFHIVAASKGKTSVVDFMVRTTLPSGTVDTPVMDARGGGLAATVGFLLRVVVLMLRTQGQGKQLLVLDESFSMVSAEYLPGISEFLREIVDKSGVQIILVTHQETLAEAADVVYRFTAKDGKTVVTHV
jgi:DNA repair exonuclease SbcCD ATPase subunit